jgi:chemotaxis protein CheD
LFYKPGDNSFNPAKFADTAIPLLLQGMIARGARKADITAKIAGGASLFSRQAAGGIGEKNVIAVRFTLQKLGIPLRSAEVGGNYGRTMKLLAENGTVIITTAGKGAKIL